LPAKLTIHTDGGSRGNPGPAAAGFVIEDAQGRVVAAKGLFLGESTNNIAEYTALVKALECCAEIGAEEVTAYSDSELMVKQINGQYKVKNARIKPLHERIMTLLGRFSAYDVRHVRRHQNAEADALVNRALDENSDVEETPAPAVSAPHKKLRLGVLISGGGRTMVNIQDQIEDGKLNAEIVVVISSRSTVAGIQRAKDAGLPVEIIRKKDSPDIETFSKRIEDSLVAAEVDLVIQGGWLCLWKIPPRYENRVMNIHPALLPSFGGRGMWGHHVHEAVLAAGCKVSGCTVHFCTNEYDAGPVIVQRTCPVADDDTPDSLAARVFKEECRAYPEAIARFAEGRLKVQGNRVKIAP